jgi:GNAT superfamily N-acetyltransferase
MSGPPRQLRIRLARQEEIPALNALIEESARTLSRGFYSPEETESAIRFVFGVDTTLIDDGTYYVAEVDGELAGCGGWSRRQALYGGDQRKVGVATLIDRVRVAARLRAFFVSRAFARQGIGRRIFEACLAASEAAGYRALELMATLPGVPLYEALGFVEVAPVVDSLPDGTPLRFLKMRREGRRSVQDEHTTTRRPPESSTPPP